MTAAIRTEGLSKSYGHVRALDGLDLEIAPGEVIGYLGPNGSGKTTTIRLLLGLIRATRGRAEIFGIDCQRDPVAAHRRLAYVPGEVSLWPSLTGTETLHLLGRVQGQVDEGYRDLLVERFELDPSSKVRAYSKGNRQKVMLIAALMTRGRPAPPRRADERPGPADGAGLPRVRRGGPGRGQTVFLSSHILSEVEALCDRVAILRAGGWSRSAVWRRCATCRPVRSTPSWTGRAPDLSGVPGVSGGRGRGQPRALPGDGIDRAAARAPWPAPGCANSQPRALARRAVPGPLLRRRRWRVATASSSP